MINIEDIKNEIVSLLKPLHPEKIILFGSFAYGIPNDNSDIDLFIIKNIQKNEVRKYKTQAMLNLYSLISKYKVGFDILLAPEDYVKNKEDYFYKIDILKNGKVIYCE